MLAEAMIQVMCMKAEERTALGNAARQRIVAQFSFEAKAVEWETLYQHVLEQNR
jgi:glycosyltransferase involved in cell wall biosynthesis